MGCIIFTSCMPVISNGWYDKGFTGLDWGGTTLTVLTPRLPY